MNNIRITPYLKKSRICIHRTRLSAESAALRRNLLCRNPEFNFRASRVDSSTEGLETLLDEVYSYHEDKCGTDCDYLRQSVKSIHWNIRTWGCYSDISCAVKYVSTFEEEEETGKKIDDLIARDSVANMTPYGKVRWAYSYITENVCYDYTFQRFSAPNALLEGCAVCSGVSGLLYRMLTKLEIPVRIITGIARGERHSWNLIQLDDGKWYGADATWDLGQSRWHYFLKGDPRFEDHRPVSSPELISQTDYSPIYTPILRLRLS